MVIEAATNQGCSLYNLLTFKRYLLTPVGFAANSIPHDGNIDLHLYKKVVTILKRKDNCREYEDETLGFTM